MQLRHGVIKTLRHQRGMTQQHLADAAGLSLRTIQRAEKFDNSSAETVTSLCAVFGVPVTEVKEVPTLSSESQLRPVFIRAQLWALVMALLVGFVLGASFMIFIK